jgi:hypothetical protein
VSLPSSVVCEGRDGAVVHELTDDPLENTMADQDHASEDPTLAQIMPGPLAAQLAIYLG